MKRGITNNDKYLNTLIKLADLFNHHGFKWSLGASMMLNLRGFNVTVNDIDIILKTKEI